MRILQVRFKNLNSLAGEWHIDLTHPAFASDGIFAITGPTGAGKTTILDAICLALYGQTPRLNKISKSGNEIMSRQTGECFAEVTFETQEGRFRCHWSQHRARKKSDGELQFAKHEIANADSEKVLETTIRGVAGQIEAVTGMDFDRFTRSMLLAQGSFAAFLQASPDDRSPILEQITGTEIYSDISVRVHERQREEQGKLIQLQEATEGIQILEPEQEAEIQASLELTQKEETGLAAQFDETGKAIAWLASLSELKKEISSLEAEAIQLQGQIEAFKPEREKLQWAEKAASLDGIHATLSITRKQQADDLATLKREMDALPAQEAAVAEQAELRETTVQQLAQAKENRQEAAPLIQKIRSLDQRLSDQSKAISESEAICQRDEAKIRADQQAKREEQEKREASGKKRMLVDDYLEKHAQDEWLVSGLTGVEEQLGSLILKQKEIAKKEGEQKKAATALKGAEKSLETSQKQYADRQQELERASAHLKASREESDQLLNGRLLREYRAEKDGLLREKALYQKIAAFEEHRAQLADGQPCPLCGAENHPFAEGNVPVPDEVDRKIEALTELINRAQTLEETIRQRSEDEVGAREKLAEAEKQHASAGNEKTTAEKTLNDLQENRTQLQTDFAGLKQRVSAKLQPLGIADIPDGDVSALLVSLKQRQSAWAGEVRKKAEIEQQLANINSAIARLDAVIQTQIGALAEKQESLASLKKAFAADSQERKALFADKKPDEEENRLNKAVADAEDAEKKAGTLHLALQQKLATTKTRIESLQKNLAQRQAELEGLENAFSSAVKSAGFVDEEGFIQAKLTVDERNGLSAKAREFDDRQTALLARKQDREARLAEETAKNITDKTREELEPQLREYDDALKDLREKTAAFRHKLHENTEAKKRLAEKQAAIDAQKKELLRWSNLHTLIGSSDGKKYRNFAQGLTFEMMIGHANRQLQKMTDRYLLVRDRTQPLELNVIDSYQAGEIRSAKNLSGGESFIVSLSLALGLSQMASKNVRVDSLFLDEGFGTLDEEALDVALQTLAGLQQDGKLIGIISHVQALKERITTQIQVTPQTGGRSRISGPGCS